jgi:DNA-binding LytR/AlgR family response regulator
VTAPSVAERKLFFVKTESRLERILLRELLFIAGADDYRCLHTTRKRVMTLETFGDLERRLPPDLVCRVHKSYMVAIDKIESVERDRITIGSTIIPVSDRYRARFLEFLGQRRSD